MIVPDAVQSEIEAGLQQDASTAGSLFGHVVVTISEARRAGSPSTDVTAALNTLDLLAAPIKEVLTAKAILVGLAPHLDHLSESASLADRKPLDDHRQATTNIDNELRQRFGPSAYRWATELGVSGAYSTKGAFAEAFAPGQHEPRHHRVLAEIQASIASVGTAYGLVLHPNPHRQNAVRQRLAEVVQVGYGRSGMPGSAPWRALPLLTAALPLAAVGSALGRKVVDDCLVALRADGTAGLAALGDGSSVPTVDQVSLIFRQATRHLPQHLPGLLSPAVAFSLSGELEDDLLALATRGVAYPAPRECPTDAAVTRRANPLIRPVVPRPQARVTRRG